MDFVDGVEFKDLDKKTKIDVLLQHASKMEEAIIDLSKDYSLELFDLSDSNVLYKKDRGFKAIDTDFYSFTSNEIYDTIKTNMAMWNEYLLYNLSCQCNAFIVDKLNLYFEIAAFNGKIRATYLIEDVLNEIKKKTSDSINTLEDYEEMIKLIKRDEYK